MRNKTVSQASLFDQAVHQLISLIKPEKALIEMNRVLDENPEILQCVHADLAAQKKNTGSRGISAERILRSAIVKQYKRYSYRELAN